MMITPDLMIEESAAVDGVAVRDPALEDAPVAPDVHVGRPDPHRGLQAAVLAVPVVVLAVLAWTHRSMFSDGFIYLHVVQNILAGHGPVFNAGQRVEAFTSPAWLALVTLVAFVTPFSLTTIAVDLGIALTLAGLVLAIVSSARLVRRAEPDAVSVATGRLGLRGRAGGLVARLARYGDGPDVLLVGSLPRPTRPLGRVRRAPLFPWGHWSSSGPDR